MMKPVLIAALCCTAAASTVASAQTHTVKIHSSDKKTIAKTTVESKIDCPAHSYSLLLDRAGKQMLFAVDGQRRPYDISSTTLGQDFLNVASFGNYAFVCGPNGIVMHFFGVEIKPAGPPVPVYYLAVISNDGEVEPTHGYEVRDDKALNPLATLATLVPGRK
jgi:hypothetical protein